MPDIIPKTKITRSGVESIGATVVDSVEKLPLLLFGRDDLAIALGIGTASLDRLDSAGKLPKPIKLGGRKLWSRVVIERWIHLGCPPKKEFESLTSD